MDITKVPNPYDFANPVCEKELFVGRTEELQEIQYYLDNAKKKARPINLAILEPRASGKTSLLNMCELEAKKREFCTVRIDLDENDITSQMALFFKLFDSILSAACESMAFEGIHSKTYEMYQDIISTYQIPEDKTFCPFLFPLQYAKAMSSRNFNIQLSDNNYKKDLLTISSEVKTPFVVLFDEGNVLAQSRIHLEKLRNIFMNIPGYMIVLTGTSALFPVMDDIFSPIVRQFKKINVRAFSKLDDTRECITKPLAKVGVNYQDILDYEDYEVDKFIKEIHDLSSGRPYEIQLICHFLFRRIQEKRSKKMSLDFGVLEDVRRELETSQDISVRPILTKVCVLNSKALEALDFLCTCDGRATFEELWKIEYIFFGEISWTKATLEKYLNDFKNEHLIRDKEDIIKFEGDDFDIIYIKYFGREQGISLAFSDFSIRRLIEINLRVSLADKIDSYGELRIQSSTQFEFQIKDVYEKMAKHPLEVDIFVENPRQSENLYFLMMDYRSEKTVPILQVRIDLGFLQRDYLIFCSNPNNRGFIDGYMKELELITKRITEVGGELVFQKYELPVISAETLASNIEETSNEDLRIKIAREHMVNIFWEYVEKSNIENALFQAELVQRYNIKLDLTELNTLGYLYLSKRDYSKAEDFLKKAVDNSTNDPDRALPIYNMGILYAKTNDLASALERFKDCSSILGNLERSDWLCGCLFLPKVEDNKLIFEELKESPDLIKVVSLAQKNIETYLEIDSD